MHNQRHVLLVDPAYKQKYPPLGLMKISQYHRGKGDHVEFVKGLDPTKRDRQEKWDRVYVSSLFTYHWAHTIGALKYYQQSVKEPAAENLVVGGVMATLMANDIRTSVSCRVVEQLLDENGKLGYEDDGLIDSLLPDYSLLDTVEYPVSDAYFAYATRGCIRRCSFCAVHKIEPEFKDYIPLADHMAEIDQRYGKKRDLVLLDNNVLASTRFADIVEQIKLSGFGRGEVLKREGKAGQTISLRRRVDFNQGVDMRLLSDTNAGLLSEIAIQPLRLAFDSIADKDLYESKVRLAVKHGIRRLSNYVLYNYHDRPEDLYERLKLNVELNQDLGIQLFSFPMRYVDLQSKDRLTSTPGNVGRNWNRKSLRAIQCILIPTYGAVTHRLDFFNAAFGADVTEFHKILLMPEDYIIHRRTHKNNGTTERWWRELSDLSDTQRDEFLGLLLDHRFKHRNGTKPSTAVRRLLEHYGRSADDQQLSLADIHVAQTAPDLLVAEERAPYSPFSPSSPSQTSTVSEGHSR